MMIAALPETAGLLRHKDALHIMDVLMESGFETRFIGGCVRDIFLQRPLNDIDLATTGVPQAVMEQLLRHHIHVVPTGLEHGTIMAVLNGKGYEITTLRRDTVTDGRHAQVEFTDDWAQDAHRRDFTVNALSVDRDGNLYDYCGGIDDLRACHLRFIDDAASRISEDYLRLLRLFRFASVLGWDIEDKELLELCRILAPSMRQLSRERIQSELFKLLGGSHCLAIISLMAEYDIFQPWLEQIFPHKLAELVTRETHFGLSDPFRRLIALSGTYSEDILNEMIVLSRQHKKRLQDISSFSRLPPTERKQEKFCYFYGKKAAEDCLILCAPAGWTYDALMQWHKPVFPLKAEHIMDQTGGANALLGQILKQVEIFWADNGFEPELSALRHHAEYLITAQS